MRRIFRLSFFRLSLSPRTAVAALFALFFAVAGAGCTVVSVGTSVVGAGVSVAATAVDVGVTVGSAAVGVTADAVKAVVP